MVARLKVTFFSYRPFFFWCVNQVVLMLTSLRVLEKSRDVGG